MASHDDTPIDAVGSEQPARTSISTITVSKPSKAPPPEPSGNTWTRRSIILSFWAIAVFLGLPIWWRTTTVYRASLPLQRMTEWADGKICNPVFPLHIVLQTPALQVSDAEHLVRVTQHALDDLNDFSAHHLRLSLAEATGTASPSEVGLDPSGLVRHHWEGSSSDHAEPPALVVRLHPSHGAPSPSASLRPHSHVLDIHYAPNMVPSPSSTSSVLGTYIANQLQNIFAEEQAMLGQLLSPSASNAASKRLSHEAAMTLARRTTRSVRYAPTYHLTFSLFTPAAFPSAWEIEPALEQTLTPLLASLSAISNFTLDTQVQSYASFSSSIQPVYSEMQRGWLLQRKDLGGFINAAEWPLSPSIGTGPTINFVLYVASPSQSPLLIEGSKSNSWLVPQWGGVVIYNPPADPARPSGASPAILTAAELQPAILTYSSQLLSLLGLPSTPASSLSLRLSTLTRLRAASLLLSASSTLGSLARLVSALPSISIPNSVADSVSSTLSHLDAACSNFRAGEFQSALQNARIAEQGAERAFFERSMVGQVYFPEEHKVAVYLPLLGPMAVPLVMSAIKEIKAILRQRQGSRKAG